MGKPAARLGDLTAHGGTVTLGLPTVLIGKMPASTLGDMHVCPMCTGPVPHVGGPITLGSTGVMLGKKPSARISDITVCVGPPSMPAMGCMTVLIGEVGSGSQAGSAASALAAAAAKTKAPKSLELFPLAEPGPGSESHAVECEFVDSAGKPLSGVAYTLTDPDKKEIKGVSGSDGRAYHGGYAKAGGFKLKVKGIKDAKWDKEKIKSTEAAKMEAEVDGVEDGTDALIGIYAQYSQADFILAATKECKVSGKKVTADFSPQSLVPDLPAADAKIGALPPKGPPSGYFFMVMIGELVAVSKLLKIVGTAEFKFSDQDGKALAGMEYELIFGDGTVKRGKLDGSGKAMLEEVPHGPFQANFTRIRKET
jgi:uncharacterized Zn-binding protein involved in type VI secretion